MKYEDLILPAHWQQLGYISLTLFILVRLLWDFLIKHKAHPFIKNSETGYSTSIELKDSCCNCLSVYNSIFQADKNPSFRLLYIHSTQYISHLYSFSFFLTGIFGQFYWEKEEHCLKEIRLKTTTKEISRKMECSTSFLTSW